MTLVSASPRRRELLGRMGHPFDIAPSRAREQWIAETPRLLAMNNARRKVRASEHFRSGDRILLGADTIIAIDDDVFGKPVGQDSARRMLSRLSGRSHVVITGICLSGPDVKGDTIEVAAAAESEVAFRRITSRDTAFYLRTREWEGKAGGYAVQGAAGDFVVELRGDLDNVIGLPLVTLREFLERHFSHCIFR